MARPCKAKRVCAKPSVEVFGPLDQETDGKVELTLEEYETMKRRMEQMEKEIDFLKGALKEARSEK